MSKNMKLLFVFILIRINKFKSIEKLGIKEEKNKIYAMPYFL